MSRETIPLTGSWRFALDPENAGIRERWYSRNLSDSIDLPGTTDEAQRGEFVDEKCDDRLSRVWRWIGPAWYQRTVEVPARWADRRLTLFMERTKDSQVWVDETWIGSESSLSTPHRYDLSDALTAGQHRLTILVDNAKLPPVGPCHQVDERTQTNWNGIVGQIELQVSERVWIDDLQLYPRVVDRSIRVVASICNTTMYPASVHVLLRAAQEGGESEYASFAFPVRVDADTRGFQIDQELVLPRSAHTWDEFDRSLVRVTAETVATFDEASEENRRDGERTLRDACSSVVGLRDFAAVGNRLTINGRPIFLRGKHDAALFPLTGYAPMSKAEWMRHLGISAEYGINHYRFHSWCPPQAAFQAADELGIYFQVELPNKRPIVAPGDPDRVPPATAYETLEELAGEGGDPTERTTYLIREGERILREYGNHPSFVMLTLGNELDGDESVMKSMCDHFRLLDDRHLYSLGTHHHNDDPHLTEGDDFWVTAETGPGKSIRGASFQGRSPGHVDNVPPSTLVNYEKALESIPIPVIAHEMAQYEVYPDYSEIPKYVGVTRARNLEIFRERLEAAGMLDQAGDFFRASGALSAICHREDVEAALRTRGFGGFQMLDLQDFSGQGTALVGMLNVFMESKGLISPEAWRRFCCETVPLLGMAKYTWTTGETLSATISVAHYGPADLEGRRILWSVADGDTVLAEGATDPLVLPTGEVTAVGSLAVPLAAAAAPRKLSIALEVETTKYENHYDAWVYPDRAREEPDGIVVARAFDERVIEQLTGGASVLLLPELNRIRQSVGAAFQTSFWCWPMFRRVAIEAGLEVAPGTLGILCDPNHPLFADFPTEFHSNWQWWRLVKAGRPLILDSTPVSYRPIVQVVDNFARNHKLGLILEANVGAGRLLVCSIDLPALTDYPEARQLTASIVRYMKSADFTPSDTLPPGTIGSIVSQ